MQTFTLALDAIKALLLTAFALRIMYSIEKRIKEHKELKKKLDPDTFAEACKKISLRE